MFQNPGVLSKYSQNDEQDHILSFFHGFPPGKFLDIGGFHPTKLSNTRCLVEMGWSGVYVEPSPLCMATFRTEYAERPDIVLVEKAITHQEGTMEFYESDGDAVSTFDLAHRDKWKSKVSYTPIQVECITMETLLKEHGQDVLFLSLDVEGINYSLFQAIPGYFWDQILMCVIEHDRHDGEMTRILQGFGFSKLGRNAENIILGKI